MKITALTLFTLLLAGCGGSSSNYGSTLPPVLAGQSYSNAAVSGTYSVNLIAISGNSAFTDTGTMTFDGNGNITGGKLTIYGFSTPCPVTVSGTYSINTDASGTAAPVLTPDPGTCTLAPGLQFKLEAAQAGETVYFTETDGNGLASGSATKQ